MTPEDEATEAARSAPQLPPALPWVVLAAVGMLFVSLGGLAQVLSLGWGLWFSEGLCFLGASWVLVRVAGADPRRLAGLDGFALKGAGFGFAVGTFNYLGVAIPLMALAELVFPPEVVAHYDSGHVFRGRPGWELALVVAGVSVAAPLCEEFFFRGVFQASLARRVGEGRALVAAALVFSAMHFDPVGFAARLELGLLFGWLWWRSGSLWPGVFAHAANNLVSSLIFLLGHEDATEVGPPWVLPVVAVVGLLGLGALWAGWRRWPAWLTSPRPSAVVAQPPVGLWRAAAPWGVGALVAVALLALIDARGVQLAWHDLHTPPPSGPAKDAVAELRSQARAGALPLETYFEAVHTARALSPDAGVTP